MLGPLSVYERLLRPVLFRMDPERAHDWALWAVARGLVRARSKRDSRLATTVAGVRFANPVGIAAGVDKGAVALSGWGRLGCGFVEVGTVTRHAQSGNPRPRLWRLPREEAVINSMGFDNPGAEAVAPRLSVLRTFALGVNLGKSRSTPLEDAVEDYALSCERLAPAADYVVVNVSSPNTPGLRSLQEPEALAGLVLELLRRTDRPLFVKISPDLDAAGLDAVWRAVDEGGAAGVIATNTTTERSVLERDPGWVGGLSGRPLRSLADEALRYLAQGRPETKAIIGVGGVLDPADAVRKMALGADLVQVYTGLIYRGPGLVASILDALSHELDAQGLSSVAELVGSGTMEA